MSLRADRKSVVRSFLSPPECSFAKFITMDEISNDWEFSHFANCVNCDRVSELWDHMLTAFSVLVLLFCSTRYELLLVF